MAVDRRPADQATREAALDPERSFIVQAPAGSGKTTLLVQRFLSLLCRVEQPERVLAITFTRKAAAEMRRRIARAMDQARRGVPPNERARMAEDKRATLELAEEVFERDQAGEPGERWELDRYPARLRVMTFDALSLELAARMPVLSQFGSVPEPTEEDEPLVLEAALRTLHRLFDGEDPVGRDVATLLDYLDNDWNKAQRLLAEMLRSRGQWRLDPGSPPTPAELDRALAFSIGHFLERVVDRFPSEIAVELAALGAYAGDRLERQESSSPIAALARRDSLPPADDVAGWRGLADLLLTADGRKWRSQWDKRQGVPPGREGKPVKDQLKTVTDSLAADERLRELLAMVRLIPDGGYDERQARVLRALHGVLVHALAEMRVVVSERGQSDFTEIALRAEEALGGDETPSELLLRLDYALDHLLVDEFQDTSWSQYRLLTRLTEGWQSGDGRTLFLVGDPMQSIYRFRDAEVGLFIDVGERGRLGAVALEPLALTVNFRSSAELVEWFNHCFPSVLPSRSDAAVGAVAYTPARAGPGRGAGDGQAVVCHPATDLADEARRVAGLVAALRRDRPEESIAVLVRSRRHLEAVLPSFHDALDVPFAGQKLERLHEHPDVCDLVALARALLHPADRVAWFAVLRAPWCGLSREALFLLGTHAGERCLPDVLDDPPSFPDAADGAALARVAPVLSEALVNRHGRALRDWVESAWLRLGGPEVVHGELGLAAVAAGLDELEQLDEDGDLPDPPWLEQSLRERFVPPDPLADDRVQVMTMHQAKGLEFDHVILPGLDRHGRRDDDPLQVWHDLPGMEEGSRTLAAVMDPPDIDAGSATVYRFVRALEKERHDYELSRLLYVACTRAGRSLHLTGVVERDEDNDDVRTPDRRSLLHRLWPVAAPGFEAVPAPREIAESDATADVAPPLRRLPPDWQPPDPSPDARGAVPEAPAGPETEPIEYAWVSEPGRIAGVVVHEYLRRVAEEGLEGWDASRVDAEREAIGRRLDQHGLDTAKRDEMVARVGRALISAITEETGRWILSPRESARNEYALTRFDGSRLRNVVLDRTFIDDEGVRWIIDYKAGERRGDEGEFLDQEVARYRDQLGRYADIVRKLDGPDTEIRAALYYPLLGALMEVQVQ